MLAQTNGFRRQKKADDTHCRGSDVMDCRWPIKLSFKHMIQTLVTMMVFPIASDQTQCTVPLRKVITLIARPQNTFCHIDRFSNNILTVFWLYDSGTG